MAIKYKYYELRGPTWKHKFPSGMFRVCREGTGMWYERIDIMGNWISDSNLARHFGGYSDGADEITAEFAAEVEEYFKSGQALKEKGARKSTGLRGDQTTLSKILIPATSAEQWKAFLAEPDKQWKTGYSARTLAHSWQEARGFPEEVKKVLRQAVPFQEIELLIAIPEHHVALPGGATPSQNDLWVLARCPDGLVSIAVEGKVAEPFGPTIKEWDFSSSDGKQVRLRFLCSTLGLSFPPHENIRYQLLHRTASALLEAKRYFAKYAVMLVHSFSQSDQWLDDYERFVSLFGAKGGSNQLSAVDTESGARLFLGWVRGEKKYLHF